MNNKLSFGISGIPLSTPKPNFLNGLKHISNVNLDSMELAFVHAVNMKKEIADIFKDEIENIKKETEKQVKISVHAPYYINLNSVEEEKIEVSIDRIIKASMRGKDAGSISTVFHPGYYMKSSKAESYDRVKKSMEMLLEKYYENGNSDLPILRPETSGKISQFGTIDELIQLSKELKVILPCIDFGHLHSITNGGVNSYNEFMEVLEKFGNSLGDRFIKNIHIHYSGIAYTEKGERNHLPIEESDANYVDLLRALKKVGAEGIVVCESPLKEKDASLLKDTYFNL